MVSYGKLVWTFADSSDRFFWISGVISAALCGMGLPSFVFLFGNIADTFEGGMNKEKILEAISQVSLILSIIGGVILLGSYLFYLFLTIASERIGAKTRVAYLKSILNQEVGWFD
jgi:hypothetical protein